MKGHHSSADNGWRGMALMITECRDGDPSIGSGRLLQRLSEIPINIRNLISHGKTPTWREHLPDPKSSFPVEIYPLSVIGKPDCYNGPRPL